LDGQVKAVTELERFDLVRIEILALQFHLGNDAGQEITWRELDHKETDDRHDDQGGNDVHDPLKDISNHDASA
jgi:hypothetical protein